MEAQPHQLWAYAVPCSTESESEAEEQERIRPKAETASAEVANISWQHATLLSKPVFNTEPGTVNVRRAAVAQTPSISSSEEMEVGILKDMWTKCHKYLTPQLKVVRGSGSWNLFI